MLRSLDGKPGIAGSEERRKEMTPQRLDEIELKLLLEEENSLVMTTLPILDAVQLVCLARQALKELSRRSFWFRRLA